MRSIPKPQMGEYAPYAIMYIDLLPDDGMVLQHLQDNLQVVEDLITPLSEEQLTTPHLSGEWTIKDVLVHVADDGRIYSYRAHRFARGDTTELPGFEQEDYALAANANRRSIDDIFAEYAAVRQATIAQFNSFDDAMLIRAGVSNGHLMSVRAAVYHLAGHELHHLHSLKENYLED